MRPLVWGCAVIAVAALACGPRSPAQSANNSASPDVRFANGRPPVVVVSREGDPASAIALAVTTAGLTNADDDPEVATALAGVVEARLTAKSIPAIVTPSWDGLRASTLASSTTEATRIAEGIRDALSAAVTDVDLANAKKKLSALSQRPLRDRALARWARCVGEPHSLPSHANKEPDLDLAKLERWRSSGLGLGRVAIAVTGPAALGELVAQDVLRGPVWKGASALSSGATGGGASTSDVDVFDVPAETGSAALPMPIVFVTLDVGSSTAAVTTAEALGDPRGPLAARLSELDLPFRLREVTGAAHARGGCVGAILEASPPSSGSGSGAAAATTDLPSRVADAIALVQLEARVHLSEMNASPSARDGGRALSRRSGDAREAAERAAWWALVDQSPQTAAAVASTAAVRGSVALGIPSRRGSTSKDPPADPARDRDAVASAVTRAIAAWDKPVVEARSRVESGQGETWVLIGSPCGTDSETDNDSGITAIFAAAAADGAKVNSSVDGVRAEPWVASDGAGLLVHGPALANETPAAQARRLADIAARSFAAEPISNASLGRARIDLLRRDSKSDGPTLAVLSSALAPQHPSWINAWGSSEPLARSSDAAVLLRAQALRAGPLRIAILANADATQADAAVRAADRWVARRAGDARTCRAPTAAQPSKPGTYAVSQRPGSIPEAYLAFPFAPGDEAARLAASIVAASLDGDLLDKALGMGGAVSGAAPPLAREASARVLGFPKAPALVLRIVASQASLDNAVMQTRALVDRLHKGGLAQADFDHATAANTRNTITTALDPRARVVATWRGEPPVSTSSPSSVRTTLEDVRAFLQKSLNEDAMIVVASRPPRPAPPPPSAPAEPAK